MKKNKELLKLILRLVENTFIDGVIKEAQVIRAIKVIKMLPTPEAIFAMSEFLQGLKRKEREHTMYIESTTPLSSVQVNKVKKIVEKRVKITRVQVNINSDLLGGFQLRVGDEIWDESVLGKIEQVKETIRR